MAELFYYRKHHELQAEIQKEACPDDKGICDLRRSLTQQIFSEPFMIPLLKVMKLPLKNSMGGVNMTETSIQKLNHILSKFILR